MDLKEILQQNPNLTLAALQAFQEEYDRRFVDQKFKNSLQKVEHTFAHLGKLMGRLADYVEAREEGREVSAEDIMTKVIPDLLVYSAWLAKEFGVDISSAYVSRMVGNMRRLYANDMSPGEIEELECLVRDRKR